MNSLTITLPIPPHELRNNARCHWAKKAKAVKAYRYMAHMRAYMAMTVERGAGRGFLWQKANVQIIAYFPTARHLDPTNLLDALKSAFDGLQDAGVIENDKNLWPLRPVIYTKQKNPRIELTVTQEST